jgi:hypothetical protein
LSVVLLAPLAACGQSASTAMPASTSEYAMPAATVPYSDHLVNGDFETPSLDGTPADYITSRYANWKYVIPTRGVFQDDNHKDTKSLPISGFNAAAFGWKSDTPAQNGFDAGSVEIQRDVKTGEQFAEIISENGLYSIYQDVSAKPGEVMRWTLKHAPRGYAGQIDHDSMQVLVGPAGHETVSPATRVTSNGTGRIGETDTTITTHATADRRFHPWETYTGTYLVPDGVTVVRFTFRALTYGDTSGSKTRSGNLVDDISFGATYPLSYNGNGGTGTPNQTN